jgi:type I restriction enzyme S subunit
MKLEELVKINYGKDYKKLKEGKFPLYGSGGIFGYVDRFISDEKCILLPRKGSINNLFFVEEKFWCVDTIFWLNKISNKVELKYLFYMLQNIDMSKFNEGSAVPSLTTATLNNIEVNLPPLDVQKEIADKISVYDDKIENNNKIIELLEEKASLLYKRYFVDFEFPNEEGLPYKSSGGKFKESEVGEIPVDWEVSYLGDKNYPIVKTGVDKFIGEKKYIATADVSETNMYHNSTNVDYVNKPSRANMKPIKNSVWFAKMINSRKLIRLSENNIGAYRDVIFSTGFCGINTSEKYSNYLWAFIISESFDNNKNKLCNGTTMQAINNTNIKKISLFRPCEFVMDMFNDDVDSLFKYIENTHLENKILAEKRDLLIKELIK